MVKGGHRVPGMRRRGLVGNDRRIEEGVGSREEVFERSLEKALSVSRETKGVIGIRVHDHYPVYP